MNDTVCAANPSILMSNEISDRYGYEDLTAIVDISPIIPNINSVPSHNRSNNDDKENKSVGDDDSYMSVFIWHQPSMSLSAYFCSLFSWTSLAKTGSEN